MSSSTAQRAGTASGVPSKAGLVAILGSLAMMGPLTIDMYLPALPAVVAEFHTTESYVQLSLTLYLLGLVLGQLLAGPISDIRGRRLPMLLGLAVYALCSLLLAFSPNIWWLIGLRALQGFFGAAGMVVSRAVARDLFSGTELTKFLTLLMIVNGAGPIIAPIIGGQLLRFTSWRGVFVVLCLVGIVMFFTVLLALRETLPANRRSKGGIGSTVSTFGRILRDRVFMGFALSSGFVTASLFAYLSGSSFVLQNVFGVSPQTYSLIFAANGLGFVLASQITGQLVGRIPEIKLLVWGYGMAAAGGILLLVGLLTGAGLAGVWVAFFLIVSSVGVVGPTSSSLALQNQGKSAGSASALLGVLSLMFGAITSPLAGLGGGHTALPLGILIAITSTCSVLCYFILIRRHQRAN
ncbi:multidrug effflux MFS transporter [Paenibacillus cremeus]|uniref:Bcr/CflA family efflux transporter n=1 Tax=Paenibacillus cremeus TaxID=2163881 RepID=A0A559KA81_9BACL|nr:multidrug effflux MFS transporter [Paenibacillus cremeus]TVY09003.1 multidrug effflux MFS transporter [Paenibacillus cremeus]